MQKLLCGFVLSMLFASIGCVVDADGPETSIDSAEVPQAVKQEEIRFDHEADIQNTSNNISETEHARPSGCPVNRCKGSATCDCCDGTCSINCCY